MRASFVVAGLMSALLSGAAAPAFAQNPGYALRFDGTTDLVRLHSTTSMMAATWPTTKTVSLWVKPTGTATCNGLDATACKVIFGDRPRSWAIARGVLNGQDRIWIWNFDGTVDSVGVGYTSGVWTQITLVHGGGVLSVYKDGVLAGSVASGATSQTSGAVLYLGGVINSTSKHWLFEGDLDEIQIWNVARSASDIAAAMTGPLTGAEPGLAAYYQMSEGTGTSVTDSSGHGWTGTLLDGAFGVTGNGPIEWVAFGGVRRERFGQFTAYGPCTEPVDDGGYSGTGLYLSGEDGDGDGLTFRITTPPTYGILAGAASAPTYVPGAHFYGTDSFAFVVNDGRVDSEPATVSIVVASVNDAPTANIDAAVGAADSQLSIMVLANDSDIDGDLLTIQAVTQPDHGTVSNEGAFALYTPSSGFAGTDTFTYTISDGHGGVATASVTVTVTETGADPGHALRFDGVSDYAVLGRTLHVLGSGWTTTKTVSLWLKPDGTPFCHFPEPSSCDAIFGDKPRWWGISRGVIAGLDRIWVWNFDGGLQSIAVPYTAGEWLHLAMVHGGGMLSAYRNGVLVGSMPSGATRQPPTGLPVLQIGGVIMNSTRNLTFKGEIDEVQFWSTARTAAEIRADMAWPLTGTEPGLAAYYRMSDGAGTQLTDDSGRGWTGLLGDGGSGVAADGPILWVPSGAFSVIPE